MQSYFAVPKSIRLNSAHYFIMKTSNRQEFQQITLTIHLIKLNISLVFIMQSYFAVPKSIRLNSAHYFIMKTSNKQEFQQIALTIHLILILKVL